MVAATIPGRSRPGLIDMKTLLITALLATGTGTACPSSADIQARLASFSMSNEHLTRNILAHALCSDEGLRSLNALIRARAALDGFLTGVIAACRESRPDTALAAARTRAGVFRGLRQVEGARQRCRAFP